MPKDFVRIQITYHAECRLLPEPSISNRNQHGPSVRNGVTSSFSRRFHKAVKCDYWARHASSFTRRFVFPSVRVEQLSSGWTDFYEILNWGFTDNLRRKLNFIENLTKITGRSPVDLCMFVSTWFININMATFAPKLPTLNCFIAILVPCLPRLSWFFLMTR